MITEVIVMVDTLRPVVRKVDSAIQCRIVNF